MANRLASERSAYLRGAAHQPVDWHPWGPEAFGRAKAEDKPVLLDIGAVWCHWCHVIDHESYDDPALAALINERFVAVKVDRDERPDVDARYQLAVQALTGQGGWPLTAFLTPEGKVFFAGTYFPPEDKYGRPGFRTVLLKVADEYAARREDLLSHAEHLHQELLKHGERHEPGDLRAESVDQALQGMARAFDVVNGGFGTAPKFPHPAALELCLARLARDPQPWLHTVVQGTLDGMARGGVHDHLGGGFHRYSVDAEWIVPHFEKMLYDNAGLLRNYAHGWMVLQEPLHRAAAEGIVRWMRDVMADPQGGLRGSQDADVGLDDDGNHWTWTLDELRAAVPDPDLQRLLRDAYDIGERGEMHHDPRRNVLFLAQPAARLAERLGLPEAMVEERLAAGKALMLQARAARPTPYVDAALYVSWNGMALGALLEAWRALGEPWCRDFAFRSLDRLLREAYDPASGMAHVLRDGRADVRGLLEDQVWMAHALIAAHQAGGKGYLGPAEALLRLVLERHQGPDGGLADVARGAGEEVPAMAGARKPIEDAPSAAPNSVAALALQDLAALTGKPAYRDAAGRILRAFAGTAPRMGLFAGAYFLALDQHLRPPTEVVIVGEARDPEARALHEAALRVLHPGMVVQPPAGDGAWVPEAARAALASGVGRGKAVALVCRGASCGPPAQSPEELRRLLDPRGGRAEGPAVRWG